MKVSAKVMGKAENVENILYTRAETNSMIFEYSTVSLLFYSVFCLANKTHERKLREFFVIESSLSTLLYVVLNYVCSHLRKKGYSSQIIVYKY